jgi:hypothetical protein
MSFVAFAFTAAQLVDIRRFCGYPTYGDGAVVFPAPWIMRQYLALEYRMLHMSQDEGAIVVATYLANLTTLETAIFGSSANLDTDEAAVWKHNRREVADRTALFNQVRRQLCDFIGISPGPGLAASGGVELIV